MSLTRHAEKCLTNRHRSADLNAFISTVDRKPFLQSTRAAPGLPKRQHVIAVKDNICTTDFPTTAGSGILKHFTSPYDATVVKQLRDAGAVIVGKTNMDEFGMGSHSMHSYFGPVKHRLPKDKTEYSAGGSSGGSAVAVVTGQCTAALGTDTGGSVRLPAAYTGVVGFKPSYGLLSRWGVIAYANSLDTVGILSSDVHAASDVFEKLNYNDSENDPTSLGRSTRKRLGHQKAYKRPLRIGIPLEYNIDTLDPVVKKTWLHSLQLLQSKGHTLHAVNLPATRHALSAYYVLAPAEASSNLAKYDGVRYGSRAEGPDGTQDSVLFAKTRGAGFGPEVQRRILLGAFSLSADAIDNYFIKAQKVRRLVQQDFDNVFSTPNPLLTTPSPSARSDDHENSTSGVDVLLCPTAPAPAPKFSEIENQDPIEGYMNDVFTVPASLAGLPAINMPVHILHQAWDPSYLEKYPQHKVGMQVIGQFGDDKLVLDVASILEDADRLSYSSYQQGRQQVNAAEEKEKTEE